MTQERLTVFPERVNRKPKPGWFQLRAKLVSLPGHLCDRRPQAERHLLCRHRNTRERSRGLGRTGSAGAASTQGVDSVLDEASRQCGCGAAAALIHQELSWI